MKPTEVKDCVYLWYMVTMKRIYPKLWVGSSIVLLTMFLAYWNYNNFQIQKDQLQQSLDSQLQLAYTEIMDSVIIEEIIVMAKINGIDVDLKNNSMVVGDATFEATSDSFHQQLKVVNLKERPDYRDSFTIITYDDDLKKRANLKMKKDSLQMMQFNVDPEQITPNEIEQADHISLMIESMFTAKDDHKPEITNLFKDKLKSLNYPSEFAADTLSNNNTMLVEYKGDREFDTTVSLQITNHFSYLLKAILPSILFSIVLLGLVLIAFWSLLSNWAKQQKLIDIKNEFVSNMTHELKTPISTVSVALEAIAGFDLQEEEEKTKEYVDISRHELNRLSLLVDKVLKMAAFDSTKNEMKMTSINLDQNISKIIRSMKLQVDEKSATINYTNTSHNTEITGDEVHISNVIYNILDNALKYSNSEPKIDIALEDNKNSIQINIKDNGKGIPTEYLEKIFDRFFRIPTSDRHNVKGHGLGLSYVKDVITKHGGEIMALNNTDQGTTFSISLPKANPHV